MKEKAKKYVALGFVIGLAGFVLYAILPYIGGFVFSIVFYFLFSPLHRWIIKRWKIKKNIAALILIAFSLALFIIPFIYVGNLVIHQSINLLGNSQDMVNQIKKIDGYFENIKLTKTFQNQLSGLGNVSQFIISNAFSWITNFFINITITYFILYYLLVYKDEIGTFLYSALPFSRNNKKIIKDEFKRITYSTIIGTGFISIIQGTIVGFGFAIFGVSNSAFWGFMCILLSFLPVVGAPIIWIPATIIQFLNQNMNATIGIFVFGFFSSIIDNILRPIVQKKIGNLHPLISLLGIVIGVPFFGFAGIIIGPLLLSYLLLSIKMVNEEYI